MAKNTSAIRCIDPLGRVVIPKHIRTTLGIKDNDPLDVSLDGCSIVMTVHTEVCIFCGEAAELEDFKGKKICRQCKKELLG